MGNIIKGACTRIISGRHGGHRARSPSPNILCRRRAGTDTAGHRITTWMSSITAEMDVEAR
jgi:hypothetical protein